MERLRGYVWGAYGLRCALADGRLDSDDVRARVGVRAKWRRWSSFGLGKKGNAMNEPSMPCGADSFAGAVRSGRRSEILLSYGRWCYVGPSATNLVYLLHA